MMLMTQLRYCSRWRWPFVLISCLVLMLSITVITLVLVDRSHSMAQLNEFIANRTAIKYFELPSNYIDEDNVNACLHDDHCKITHLYTVCAMAK